MRVVVADDAVLIREGLVRLLEEFGCEVVATVGDGDALVDAIAEHKPDVSVVDVRMPPSFTDEGLRAAVEARRRVPGAPVLILSQYVEVSYADDLLADRSAFEDFDADTYFNGNGFGFVQLQQLATEHLLGAR